MQTKIVLTGTFSVGKTTLLNLFRDNAHIVPEVARDILEVHPELMKEPEFQDLILIEQLDRERLAKETGHSLVVLDRGIIDVIAYCRYFGHKEPQVPVEYNKIFLCSPNGVPCAYGNEAEEMRKNLHNVFLEVLHEKQLPFVLLEGSANERYVRIQEELSTLRNETEGRNWYEKR